MSSATVECVVNVSEGRRPEVITAMANAIRAEAQVQLLHQDVGEGANRTVFTFVGTPAGVEDAAYRLYLLASHYIDMRLHYGEHPRMGAIDVCPFIPINGCSIADCVALAHRLAKRVWDDLGVPVYLYEAAATAPHRKNLAHVRRGEYEGLAQKHRHPAWRVDYGNEGWNPRSGTTIIGARPFLIAWNINLATTEVSIAKKLAGKIRESGHRQTLPNGKKTRQPGLFPGLKAIGWFIEEYGRCQISTNVVDPDRVNLLTVYQRCERLATELGTRVTGSELIGLIPRKYLLAASVDGTYDSAIQQLGLDDLTSFNPNERVLEEVMQEIE
ncbi:MAG: glutamate formimidoyltransferase [Bacteroidota bacterium]